MIISDHSSNRSSKALKVKKDEENVALASKGKEKKGLSQGQGAKGEEEEEGFSEDQMLQVWLIWSLQHLVSKEKESQVRGATNNNSNGDR